MSDFTKVLMYVCIGVCDARISELSVQVEVYIFVCGFTSQIQTNIKILNFTKIIFHKLCTIRIQAIEIISII